MNKILQKESPELRLKSTAVEISKIKSKKIQDLIKNMFKSLAKELDGVAIAAPQIGELARIFVVSPRIKEILKVNDLPLVYINPVITKSSRDKKSMEEGCLSVRWLYGNVKRATRTVIEAYNENGEKFTQDATGLLSQIFQHETDHLNGVLFIDKAKDVRELPQERRANLGSK